MSFLTKSVIKNPSAYSIYYRRWMENFDSSQVLVIDGTDMIQKPWDAAKKAQVRFSKI